MIKSFVPLAFLMMVLPASAQNVNQTIRVEPGTVITITRNGSMLMQKHVEPGLVRIVITYLNGGGRHGRRR